MRLISLIILILILSGCATPRENVIIKTEYKTVEVPVMYNLERPDRPKKQTDMSLPEYLLEVLTYTETLEYIIDGVNN